MRTPVLVVLGIVLVVTTACSSSSTKLRARAGHPSETTSTSIPTTSTAVGGTPAASTSAPLKPVPPTTAAPATAQSPTTSIAATTPTGPPPDASTGRGLITGHVYHACTTSGSNAACHEQHPLAGDTITAKSGDSVVAVTHTAADGSYRVEVPAGLYTVDEAQQGFSTRVQVNAGQTVVVDF